MHDTRTRRTSTCTLKHDLVVQTQSELWHSRQIAFHLDCSKDFRANNVAICINLNKMGAQSLFELLEKGRTKRLTLSITSRKTSFFLYLIPSDRHETALVTAIGGRTCTSSLCDSCVIYLQFSHIIRGHMALPRTR